ncbi:MAG: chromosomal replication initiator protein DnaA [bacterium]|jgi:chromosomal replication initiator protein|nr:chromosomal replication initiator protein DnaA [candidate division KSB1 bacterium]MDH7561199.1 chromosomal replication initiator protein DnaA [bacterium]
MERTAQQVWADCLSLLRDRVSSQSFTTWFKPVEAVKLEGRQLTIQVPSQFFYEWIDQHYRMLIEAALVECLGEGAGIQYAVVVGDKGDPFQAAIPRQAVRGSLTNGRLSEQYTFENFVEGASNQFAKAAAVAVSQSPGNTAFNPLVIYGGAGLGKTHLIQAIGNHAIFAGTARRVAYVSSEKFTLEFINSIQQNKTTEFSANYRNVDLLLVDDIQFFSNKERTLDEFFHTFNALYHEGRQIVLTSDRPPRDLPGMQERLISRFQWGLIVDIQVPDYETRLAILHKKADQNGLELPEEIFDFIAINVTMNIRELEGSLIKLLAYSSLTRTEITLETAKRVLRDICLPKRQNMTVEYVQRVVANYFAIPEDMMRAKTRRKEIALARQVAMYLAKVYTSSSLKTIGLHFGGRDHSTVIHALNLVEKLKSRDAKFRQTIEEIEHQIRISSS